MVVEIKKSYPEKKKKSLIERLRKEGQNKPRLKDVFGILKDGSDGLKYQKKIRNEWS